jgi:hypothetical protein
MVKTPVRSNAVVTILELQQQLAPHLLPPPAKPPQPPR